MMSRILRITLLALLFSPVTDLEMPDLTEIWRQSESRKSYVASDWIKQRMKYHGIYSATCEGGVCWFVRNGKRMNL